ncbi:taste receptor type 1 member 1-like [Pelodytes ibericus]
MRYAISEINNSSRLLPNVTLGYEMFDICSDSANIYGSLKLLSQHTQPYIRMMSNFTQYNPKVLALIGPFSSSFAFVNANILSAFLVPQVSYAASNEQLSFKQKYPSFLRTIPSDKLQVEVMLHLLQRFNWTWIAIVGSDEAYGRGGVQNLNSLVSSHGICVAYQALIPYSMDRKEIRTMLDNVMRTRVNVIVVFAAYFYARIFFEEVVLANVTERVWIGSEDWIIDSQIAAIPNIKQIGTIFGVSVVQNSLPGLQEFYVDYIRSLSGECAGEYGCNQGCTECQGFTLLDMPILSEFEMPASFNVYSAVYAISQGLHRLLHCESGQCSTDTVYPWQLLEQIKKVNFSLYNQSIYFDENGDPASGYDIVMYNWIMDTASFTVIGSFSKNPRQLDLRTTLTWFTKDNSVPESICSRECGMGERRVQAGTHTCCFQCLPCPSMTFLNKSDLYTCQQCHPHQWSPAKSGICYNRTSEYLAWSDPISIVLLITITLLIVFISAIALIFTQNLHTPVVKSAGGKMCLVMLASLALSCLTLYCYFGKPSRVACMIRQPVFAVSFTVCFSCLVVHAFQIVCIFKMAAHLPKVYEIWVKKNGSDIFIVVSSVGQVLISLIWILLKPPQPIEDYTTFQDQIIFKCSETDSVGSFIEIVYIGILSVFCFIFCYMGKDLPENYNEAKCISFSLLVYFFSWIGFFTTYIVYQGKYIAAVNVITILASVSGILAGYFSPKCYVILFRKELNTTEHFQTAIQNYTKKQSDQ